MIARLTLATGASLLLIGIFAPMIAGHPLVEVKSFFTWGGPLWDGMIALLTVAIAGGLAWARRMRWAGALIGGLNLLLVYGAYAEFNAVQEASRAQGGVFKETADHTELSYGLPIMMAGAVVMMVSSVLPPYKPD